MNAIFYKEWIKTKWYLLAGLIVLLCFSGYSMLNVNRIANLKGIDHLWEVMISRDAIFVDLLKYVPLILGALLAVVQFVPEMHRKCLKLTLHLPFPQLKMVSNMLIFGAGALIICFAIEYMIMFLYLQSILAYELYMHILLTALTWHIAGVLAYFFASWICLEPTWKMRTFYIFLSVLTLRIFFIGDTPEGYNGFLPVLTIFTICALSLSWLSIARFKEGKQD